MTAKEWIESITILSQYAKGMDGELTFFGEHDIIYSEVDTDKLPKESADGKRLNELGWHVDEGGWAKFT